MILEHISVTSSTHKEQQKYFKYKHVLQKQLIFILLSSSLSPTDFHFCSLFCPPNGTVNVVSINMEVK